MLVMMIANDKDNIQLDERDGGIARHGNLINTFNIIAINSYIKLNIINPEEKDVLLILIKNNHISSNYNIIYTINIISSRRDKRPI